MGIEQDPSKYPPSHTRFQRGSSSIRHRFRTATAADASATPSGGVFYSNTPSLVGVEGYDYDLMDNDFYMLSKSYFDCREYRRPAHALRDQSSKKAVFLQCYDLYLVWSSWEETLLTMNVIWKYMEQASCALILAGGKSIEWVFAIINFCFSFCFISVKSKC